MIDVLDLKNKFKNCECGFKHEFNIKDVCIGSGITSEVGKILIKNGFGKNLLLVADENTLNASHGILEALKDFNLTTKIYKNLRDASMEEVETIKSLLKDLDGVISVGTGSLNDICRKASADVNKLLCLFATAPSMDGFASYSAPITLNKFKLTYPAKSPEVIIADTKILAAAPVELKSAGFGDMIGKYVGLIDWQISHLITGEYYCEKVASLTREATDRIMALADRITANDEESARAVFEALLLTGIGMSFTKTSRPASGTEHTLSHFWECLQLVNGDYVDYHGKTVGVATIYIMELYEKLYNKTSVKAHKDNTNWEEVYKAYGPLKGDIIKLNTPKTITDDVLPSTIEENWQEIRKIIKTVPSLSQIKSAMLKAGCALTAQEIGVSDELLDLGLKYHTYMRNRFSLRRILPMIE